MFEVLTENHGRLLRAMGSMTKRLDNIDKHLALSSPRSTRSPSKERRAHQDATQPLS